MILSAESARSMFSNRYTYADLDKWKLHQLALLVMDELAKHNLSGEGVEMWLRNPHKLHITDTEEHDETGIVSAFIRVDGAYFKQREAISFNADGFIGFAGWSDSKNIKPFLAAFERWLDWMGKGGEQ